MHEIEEGIAHDHALHVIAIHTKQIARPVSEARRMRSAG
jgi:hypothetical protein